MWRASGIWLAVWVSAGVGCAQSPPTGYVTGSAADAGEAGDSGVLDAPSNEAQADDADAETPDGGGDGEAGEGDDAGGDAGDDALPPDAGHCDAVGQSKTCGLVPQCGCAANATCDVQSDGDTICVGPAGTHGQGELCASTFGCTVGLSCVIGGACHALCDNPGKACGDAGRGDCVGLFPPDAGAPTVGYCEVACQLQDPNTCGAGVACYPSSVTSGTDCTRAGPKGLDASCTYMDDCAAGLGCVSVGGVSSCKAWCRVGKSDCAKGTCTGFSPALVIAGTTYGTCP